jgi:hypothetical protein
MKRLIRFVTDILMLIMLIVLLATMRHDLAIHAMAGGTFVILMAVHLIINRKWVTGMVKGFKKIKPRIRRQLIVNIILATAWTVCIITGILAGVHTITGLDALFFVRIIHGATGAIALILTIVHIIQHRKKFMGLVKKRDAVQA